MIPTPWWRRFVLRFHRLRGPIVRYWSAEFDYLGRDPQRVETWPDWRRRQARRLVRR